MGQPKGKQKRMALKDLKKMVKPRKWDARYQMADYQQQAFNDQGKEKEVRMIELLKVIKEELESEAGADFSDVFSLSMVGATGFSEEQLGAFDRVTTGTIKHYVWLVLAESGLVLTVGRTSFNRDKAVHGDLFAAFDLREGSGTQRILLHQLATPAEQALLATLNQQLNGFISEAIIIPVNVQDAKEAGVIERKIGQSLITSGIPVLNYYSHNW